MPPLAAPAAATAIGTATTAGLSAGTVSAGLSLSSLATAASISGTLLNIVGTLQAGEAESQQSKIEREIAEGQALQEELRGVEEERLRRKAGEKLEARQRAQFAKGGVKVGEGTPLLVMAETLFDVEEDVLAIKQGTQARAGAFRRRAQTFRSIGKASRRASRFKAGSSLLSGISDIVT